MAKKLVGTVTSDVQDKTIVVSTVRRVTHPLYGKQYTVTKKFTAHDEGNKAHVGDKVEIVETRPVSKNKTFKLSRVVEAGHGAIELKEEEEVLAPAVAEKHEKQDESSLSGKPSKLGQAGKTQTATGSSREKEA